MEIRSAAQSEIKAYFVHAALKQNNNKERPNEIVNIS
jgi:hypothetical protein